jgi:DNA polymerase-4
MIIYFHVPGFYAAVEQADNPQLRGRAVIVGGDPRKRGSVTSASAEARGRGVLPGMLSEEALELCPDATLRPTRLRRYREVARELRALLRGATDRLEEDGLDGTYLEPPAGTDAVPLAAELSVSAQAETGVRAVAGIGPTRFVAYLAGMDPGPGGIRRIPEEQALAFLAPFPVSALWGLGPSTAEKLAARNIATVGDLQRCSHEELEASVGRHAASFLALANAQERDPLRPSPRAKSLSQEETLAEPSVDLRLLGDRIFELAGRLEALLERERRIARTVTLSLRYVDGTQVTRTQTPMQPVGTQTEVRDVALELLARTHAGTRLVRRLRLQVSNLTPRSGDADPRQLRLFP